MKNKKPTKEQVLRIVRSCVLVLAGSILFDLGVYTFARDADFAPGGVSGLALILNHVFNLPIGITSLVLNIPLILLCWRLVGKRFLVYSGVTMLLSSLLIDFVLPFTPTYTGSRLLSAMFSGAFIGIGLALIYMCGSSTGGTDFLILSIKKLRPHMSVGQISMYIDGAIILLGGFIYGNIDAVLYGVICTISTSVMMDKILYGIGSSKLVLVVTNHGQDIANAISDELGRGSTLVNAMGTYSNQERHMLYCACAKSQVYRVRAIALQVDPDAFVMITEASEVYGEGFLDEGSSLLG